MNSTTETLSVCLIFSSLLRRRTFSHRLLFNYYTTIIDNGKKSSLASLLELVQAVVVVTVVGDLAVLLTAKITNEWVLNKAGVNRELLDTVKARKLAYYGHTMRKQGSWLEKEIMQGTMPGVCR